MRVTTLKVDIHFSQTPKKWRRDVSSNIYFFLFNTTYKNRIFHSY